MDKPDYIIRFVQKCCSNYLLNGNKVLLISSRYERKNKIQIRGKRYDCVFTAILLFDFVQFSKFLKIEKNKIQIRKIQKRAL